MSLEMLFCKNVTDTKMKVFYILLFISINIVGQTAQNISIVELFRQLGSQGDVWTILTMMSAFFAVTFFITHIVNCFLFQREDQFWPGGSYVLAAFGIGIFDSLNGLFVVYFSNPERVPPVIQTLLFAVGPISAVIFSRLPWLRNKVNPVTLRDWKPLVAIVLIFISTTISAVTASNNDEGFDISFGNIIYGTCMFAIGVALAAFYNILQKPWIKQRLNSVPENKRERKIRFAEMTNLLAWQTLGQFMTSFLLFWTDFIPHFGTSASISDFFTNSGYTLLCSWGLLSGCFTALIMQLIFSFGYYFSYFASAYLNKESPIITILSGTIVEVVACFIWLSFPSLNPTGGIVPVWAACFSLVFSLSGMTLWIYHEHLHHTQRKKKKKSSETENLFSQEETENIQIFDP